MKIMKYISTSKTAKIIGINKKTLLRWDEQNKFSPKKRGELLKERYYDPRDVEDLKLVIDHENRYKKTVREMRDVINKLKEYKQIFAFTNNEVSLDKQLTELRGQRSSLIKEFDQFTANQKRLHKKYFQI